MPQGAISLKDIERLIQRARWFVTLLALLVVLGLGWRAWQSGSPLDWLLFGLLLALLVLIGPGGGWITARLMRLLERQLLSASQQTAHQLVDVGLDQGGALVKKGGQQLDRAVDRLDKTVSEVSEKTLNPKGTVTWVTVAPPPDAAPGGPVCAVCGQAQRPEARFCHACGAALAPRCPACGLEVRPQAKFCDHCGAAIPVS